MNRKYFSIAGVILLVVFLAACQVTKDNETGQKTVSIGVPGAGIHVEKGGEVPDFGVPIYPGATTSNTGSQASDNISLEAPGSRLRVLKRSFSTPEEPKKVLAYYRQQLGSYGKVIECRDEGEISVGLNSKDWQTHSFDDPVFCGSNHSGGTVSLKVGRQGDARVVKVRPSAGGSSFELMYVHAGEEADKGRQPS